MALTFNPPVPPQEGAAGRIKFRSNRVQFGDGYLGVSAEGLNPRGETWTLVFKGTDAEINPIKDFLDAHGTHISFNWTPPNRALPGLYLMEEGYDENPSAAGNQEIRVTFIRRYTP